MAEGQQALKEEDLICGHKLAELIEKHSSEAFYALDGPLEAAIFSVLIELMKEAGEEKYGSLTRIIGAELSVVKEQESL